MNFLSVHQVQFLIQKSTRLVLVGRLPDLRVVVQSVEVPIDLSIFWECFNNMRRTLTNSKRMNFFCVHQVQVPIQKSTRPELVGFVPDFGVLAQSEQIPIDLSILGNALKI